VSLRSFGFPYLKPLGPVVDSDLKDSIIRAPLWAMRTRPRLVVPWDIVRQADNLRPEPPPQQTENEKKEEKEG
jgi:spore germination protein KA